MIFKLILLSIMLGLPILCGIKFARVNKSKQVNNFVIGLSFMILIGLLISDVIPSLVDKLNNYYDIGLTTFGQIVGILALLCMEFVIPYHNHKHEKGDTNKIEHKMHMYHIGISILPLVIILNIFKGITFINLVKDGINNIVLDLLVLMFINFILSALITTNISNNKKTNTEKYIILFISGIIGLVIGLIFGALSSPASIIFLSIISGMILYTGIFELGIEASSRTKEKGILEGVLVGAIITALLLI